MSWGSEQDNLLWEMREFLKEHSIYELLDLVDFENGTKE